MAFISLGYTMEPPALQRACCARRRPGNGREGARGTGEGFWGVREDARAGGTDARPRPRTKARSRGRLSMGRVPIPVADRPGERRVRPRAPVSGAGCRMPAQTHRPCPCAPVSAAPWDRPCRCGGGADCPENMQPRAAGRAGVQFLYNLPGWQEKTVQFLYSPPERPGHPGREFFITY